MYSRSNTPLRSSATTFGFASSASAFIFSPTRSAFAKKIRPSSRNSNSPGKVSSSGCSLERGRKTFVPGLRPEHVDRRIGRLVGEGDERDDDGDENSLQGPEQHHAGQSGQGPTELRSPHLRESRGTPPA